MNSPTINRSKLRQEIRLLRKGLSVTRKTAADLLIHEQVKSYLQQSKLSHLGLYHPIDGEPDLLPLVAYLRQQQCQLALPRISPDTEGRMHFHNWPAGSKLQTNRFGIKEPEASAGICNKIEVVLAPLVAFSNNGTRLGMGAGYYDRWLVAQTPKPLLVGIAYELQRVDLLPAQPWDIPLDMVITETGTFSFPGN